MQGLAGGDFKAALAGASAPYLAELIHKNTTTTGPDGKEVVNTAANLMAHAVVGAVIAQAQGNSALSGASGAALGEFIAQEMYPGIARTDLNEEQKQTISALGTLAAGLAGGLADGSASGAIAGAQAGENAAENNALDDDELEKEHEHGNVPVKIIPLNPSKPDLFQEDSDSFKGGGKLYSVSGPIKPVGIVSSFDANDIRFSQNTVSYNKTEQSNGMKYTYDDLVSSMKKDGWKGEPVDVIKMPDGKVTSMDNTRIRAAREAGIKVQANLRDFDEALPKDMVDSGRFGLAKTWGEAITGRINNQSGGFSKNNPNGSAEFPRVTGKDK
nr:VENN motif pre-toxin domain-containing protein [Pantoea ananatis]